MKKRNMILVIIMMFALAGCASLDEEVKKDSANTITKEEMAGIWKADTADTHRGYFYFADQGYLYYMASKTAVNQSSFTSEYRSEEHTSELQSQR